MDIVLTAVSLVLYSTCEAAGIRDRNLSKESHHPLSSNTSLLQTMHTNQNNVTNNHPYMNNWFSVSIIIAILVSAILVYKKRRRLKCSVQIKWPILKQKNFTKQPNDEECNNEIKATDTPLIYPKINTQSVHSNAPEQVGKKFVIKVQVYSPQGTGEDFVKDLVKRLSQQASIKLEFNMLSSDVEIKSDQQLLVVCMNSTRLGTDAKTVVKNVQGHKRSSLVIFHNKDKQSLETEQPSWKILVGEEFDQFHNRIFDIGCWTGSGVYSCNINTKSISNILEFCTEGVASCRQSEKRRSTYFVINEKAKIK